jgi:transcriptional regulator with XRE-family HTH domain
MARSTHHADYQLFLTLLREAREHACLTQVGLAARLGGTQTFVSKFERGERRIDLIEMIEISEAMGLSPEVLLAKFLAERRKAHKVAPPVKKLSKKHD